MIKIVVAACALILGAAGLPPYLTAGDLPKIVGQDGSIERPGADFRRDWSHLGSWAVLDKDSAAHGIHDVYATRATVDAFRATGKYPDGAVLVKEIRSFETDQLTTGNVAYAGNPAVWFVMVKDSTGRFEGKNPLWAEGWGWAMFQADNPEKQTAESFETSCMGCHTPVAKTDWVFQSGYPTLK
jgi:hypothetical protein